METKKGKIEIVIGRDSDNARITITDEGSGIAPENLEKIFEPFFTTKHVGEGTGLGMWVSYGIVQSFGGDITLKSTLGQGASFCVVLPLNAKEH
jgi:signal transduction histidine kinase